MSYTRKFYRRKRRYNRRRPITYGQIGSKIFRDIRWLKSVINVEKKYLDIGQVGQNITNSGTFYLLNGLTTGTSATTRNGQSIKAVSCYLDAFVRINASATQSVIRLVIVRDKQANGVAPGYNDIFNGTDTTSPINIGNSKRFRILVDKHITLSINGTEIKVCKYFKYCKFHTEYNTGTAGTIADIQTNSLYLITLSNESVNYPAITFTNRFRWIDN